MRSAESILQDKTKLSRVLETGWESTLSLLEDILSKEGQISSETGLSQSSAVYHTPRSWSEMSEEMLRLYAQELNEANRHALITQDLWWPNSHDLNPVNYIWSWFSNESTTKMHDVNDLRQRLMTHVWAGVEQIVIDDTIAWRAVQTYSNQKRTFSIFAVT